MFFSLYKKGRADDPGSYRPIALLSQLRKLVEKVLDSRVRDWYQFEIEQCGFQKSKSMESGILRAHKALSEKKV